MNRQVEISQAVNEGRCLVRSFNKNLTVNGVVGTALDLSGLSGNPIAQYFIGIPGVATQMSYLLNDKGIDHGGTMGGYKKFISNIFINTVTSTLVPCTLRLCDYLMFYAFNSMDTGLQELTNSVSIPRYTAREGVQMMMIEQNPYVGGATVQVGYTNQDGVEGRLTPVMTLNTTVSIGTIATSAPTLAGAKGDFLPLQYGDYGVQKIDTLEFLTGDVGTVCLLLVKPIISLPIYEIMAPCDWNLWFHLGLLPEIKNDAYLNFIYKPAVASTGAVTNTIYGDLTTVWKQN
jgi:acetoacetate decarboxylase